MLITMSSSLAPFVIAVRASYIFTARPLAPKGKPITVAALTSESWSARRATGSQNGNTTTVAK